MSIYGDPEGTFSSIRSAAEGADVESYRTTPQFAVSLGKLAVLSLVTFGLYDVYWCYKQWDAIRKRENEILSPFWRAAFAPLWGFSLFPRIQKLAEINRVPVNWSGSALAVVYLIMSATWRLPAPLSHVSLLAFLPILMVQRSINELNAAVAPQAPKNDKYSATNVIWIFIGGVLLAWALFGALIPEAAPR